VSISLFRTNKFVKIDLSNISTSLYKMVNLIRNKNLNRKNEKNIPAITEFSQATWDFISSIHEVEWNLLKTDNESRSFQ